MAKLDIQDILARLNPCTKQALEAAAALCVTSSHREVAIEHFLDALLDVDGCDFRTVLSDHKIDRLKLKRKLEIVRGRFKVAETGRTPQFSPILMEVLEDAWLIASTKLNQRDIRSGAVLIALLSDRGRYLAFDYYEMFEPLSSRGLIRDFDEATAGSVEASAQQASLDTSSERPVGVPAGGDGSDSALQRFCRNFTQDARDGKIDPVFCRDSEIRQAIEILGRRRKNNPICVGEAGVGKTALAEGLALKVVSDDVPKSLKGVEIWSLDMGALQAGAAVKGEFEKRLKAVIDEVRNSATPIVLFIDEAHTLVGAGGPQGGGDAANLLKPVLARGELKTIAATTWSEYKKYFEKDPALSRRFQLINLKEPTVDQCVTILRGLKAPYEKAHGVYITDEALVAAAELSARYISGRQLPDKAIDVLDTACARTAASMDAAPLSMEELRQEKLQLERELEALKRDQQTGAPDQERDERIIAAEARLLTIETQREAQAKELERQRALSGSFFEQRDQLLKNKEDNHEKDQQANLSTTQDALRVLRAQIEQTPALDRLVSVEVGPKEVADIIADWTGVPVSSMTEDDFARLLKLSETMGETIKGQDHALVAIEERLRAARLDLHREGQPLGVFLLVGPSGVGKTETALEVARRLFGGEQFVTTINMSEYQEQHTISRLIGSPPGYVGYGEGGILTEALRKMPYSVILLDEVEKAEPNVLNLFYQAFDKGVINDGEGREIDCKNAVFLLTSNLGSDQIEQWVANAEEGKPPTPANMLRSLQPLLADHFKPALLARMEPIVYQPLSDEVMKDIVTAKLNALVTKVANRMGLTLEMDDALVDHFAEQCKSGSNGARLVDQVIQRKLLPVISMEVLTAGQEGEKLSSLTISLAEDGGYRIETALEGSTMAEAAE